MQVAHIPTRSPKVRPTVSTTNMSHLTATMRRSFVLPAVSSYCSVHAPTSLRKVYAPDTSRAVKKVTDIMSTKLHACAHCLHILRGVRRFSTRIFAVSLITYANYISHHGLGLNIAAFKTI